MRNRERPTVLLVDDDPQIVQIYGAFLEETCDVVTARDGHEALERIDESVDVVLLDRQMSGMDGDRALATLRERGCDVPVGMVSGKQPERDIIELPVDDYLTKPVGSERLREAVELLAICAEFDDQCREFFRLAAKKAALEGAGTVERGSSERFQKLLDRMETIQTNLGDETEKPGARRPDETPDSRGFRDVVREVCISS